MRAWKKESKGGKPKMAISAKVSQLRKSLFLGKNWSNYITDTIEKITEEEDRQEERSRQ